MRRLVESKKFFYDKGIVRSKVVLNNVKKPYTNAVLIQVPVLT